MHFKITIFVGIVAFVAVAHAIDGDGLSILGKVSQLVKENVQKFDDFLSEVCGIMLYRS